MDIVIAIDGPVASGKSTVANLVAKKLNYRYIDTGAMYRCIALEVYNHNIDGFDEAAIQPLLENIKIELKKDGRIFLNNNDVSKAIRVPEISRLVSIISIHKSVRDFLLQEQREMAKNKGVVMEGRDIGSFVVPDAELKIFQFASISSRAKRRYEELRSKGMNVEMEDLINDIKERDERDSSRKHAPLIKTSDAVELDTSEINAEQVADFIVKLAREKING